MKRANFAETRANDPIF